MVAARVRLLPLPETPRLLGSPPAPPFVFQLLQRSRLRRVWTVCRIMISCSPLLLIPKFEKKKKIPPHPPTADVVVLTPCGSSLLHVVEFDCRFLGGRVLGVFSDKSRLIKGCFGFFSLSAGSAGIAGRLISSVSGGGNWKLPGRGASLTLSSDCKNVYRAPLTGVICLA